MSFPTTAVGLLVIVLAVLPGLPGDYLYRMWAGTSWRERDMQHLLRLLSFSLLGLVLYSVCALYAGWYLPMYLIPSTFTGGEFDPTDIPRLGIAYFGHFAGSALVGLSAAAGTSVIRRVVATSPQQDTWDHFIHHGIPGHWVVITLQDGDAYAGMVEHADVSVEPQYRDLILSEPYLFETESKQYHPTYNQYLFIKGADVASIAVVHNPTLDKRVVPVAETPFRKE